ncbi:ROK family protein [soil metagenome]
MVGTALVDAPLVAGVELGGTKCVVLLATGPNDIRAEARIDTTTPHETLDAIEERLREWRGKHRFRAIGLASFGPLELDPGQADHGCIVNTPKPGWSGTDLIRRALRFGLPLALDTDVNGAALAEGRWGGAQGLSSFAYVTVGTGIGIGSIVNGLPVRGLGHSEAGHLRVPRLPGRKWPGACPYHGDCVEGIAAGPAILAQAGFPAETLTRSDPVWDDVVQALAGCFHNLVLTTAPERILIGGGVGQGQAHLLPRIRAALVESLNGYGAAPRIAAAVDAFLVHPALGNRAGPMGAIALAQNVLAQNVLAQNALAQNALAQSPSG